MPQTKLGNENDNGNEVNNEWCENENENENENEWVKLKLTKRREKKLNWAQNVETKSVEEESESESETSGALQFFRVKLFYKCGCRVIWPHL